MAAEKDKTEGKTKALFQKLAENDTCRRIIVWAGILGIALILISGNLKSCSTPVSAGAASSASSVHPAFSAEAYEQQMAKQLSDIVSQIDGVGRAQVMVTLEQTSQNVYATQEKTSDQQTSENAESGSGKQETNNSDEKNYLIVKDENGTERTVPVTEIQPLVKGVVVVCDGGGDPKVQQSITDAVTTALHISSTRVCVIKAK